MAKKRMTFFIKAAGVLIIVLIIVLIVILATNFKKSKIEIGRAHV